MLLDHTGRKRVHRRFVVRDVEGAAIVIDPEGGTMTAPLVEQEGIDDGPYVHRLAKWLDDGLIVLGEDHIARGTERALRLGDRVLVLGAIERGEDGYRGDATVTLKGNASTRLTVTRETQADLRKQHRASFRSCRSSWRRPSCRSPSWRSG